MFKPKQYDSGKLITLNTVASAHAITKGDALAFSAGLVQRATGSNTEVRYVAMEAVTSVATSLPIICLAVDGVRFEADCTHSSAQSQVGTKVDLTDHANLDNDSASTDYVFFIEKLVGAVTDKKVEGYFVLKVV